MRSGPSKQAAIRCNCCAPSRLQVRFLGSSSRMQHKLIPYKVIDCVSTSQVVSCSTSSAYALNWSPLLAQCNRHSVDIAVHAADYDLTGQIMWPAAQLLADYLAANTHIMSGCPCALEFGSGLGFPGIIAAQASPFAVCCGPVQPCCHRPLILQGLPGYHG